MSENVNYEMMVSAKIVSNPEFKIPAVAPEEIEIFSLSEIDNILSEAYQALKSGSVAAKVFKIIGKFDPVTSTTIDIMLSLEKEGRTQAIITGVGSTLTTLGVLAVFGLSPVSVVGGLTFGLINLAIGHLYDGIYDYGEQVYDIYKNQNGKAIVDTSISNLSNIRELVAPLYSSAADSDINEIEVRVKPKNEGDEAIVYTIKKGDTVWDLCQKYDVTYEELFELNPWLRDRFSDDMKFALIRPDEKLRIPVKDLGLLGERPTIDVPFNQAQTVGPVVYDPILIDLNNDGIISTTSVENGIYFDHGKDGFAENSAWVSSEDGILVIDKNNDGIINNGGEIFGDNYIKSNGSKANSGFDALKDLDSNNDGKITSADAEFNSIKILKGDGTLLTLEEAGITSINLSSTTKNIKDESGNTLVSQGTFVRTDGTTGNLGDFNLVVDKMNSFAVEWLDESEDIAALPEVLGSGTVYSLHQAMVRDESGELKELVEEFISISNSVSKREKLLEILYKWTGADSVLDGSRGNNFDAKKLYVLEKFIGKGFVGVDGSRNPNNQACNLLSNAFNTLMNNIYASLMSQTELKDVFDKLEIVYDFDTETVSYDLSKVQEHIDNLIAEDETSGKALLLEFSQSFVNLGLKDNSNFEEYYNYYVSKGDDYKYLLETINKNCLE